MSEINCVNVNVNVQLLQNSSRSFCRQYWLNIGEHILQYVVFESSSYYKVMVRQWSFEHGFRYFEPCFRRSLVYFQRWSMGIMLIWVESWLWRSSLLKNSTPVFWKRFSFSRKSVSKFRIFTDCHIKACWFLKQRAILKFPITVFSRTYTLSVCFKMKPLRKSVFQC